MPTWGLKQRSLFSHLLQLPADSGSLLPQTAWKYSHDKNSPSLYLWTVSTSVCLSFDMSSFSTGELRLPEASTQCTHAHTDVGTLPPGHTHGPIHAHHTSNINTRISVSPPGWGLTRCKTWNVYFTMLTDETPIFLATEKQWAILPPTVVPILHSFLELEARVSITGVQTGSSVLW